MTLPVLLGSNRRGAPTITNTNGSINAVLHATLVTGFNTQAVTSATVTNGTAVFNFPSDPGFAALDWVIIEGASAAAANGRFRTSAAGGNQVSVPIAGVVNGALGGTITMKFAPLGWSRPFVSGTTTASYQQGGVASHKRHIRVYDGTVATTNTWFARAYESMTAISSGVGPYPTTAEVAGNGVPLNGSQTGNNLARPWMIIGTPRFFYFFTDTTYDYSDMATPYFRSGTPGYGSNLHYGELARIQKPGDVYAYVLNGDFNAFSYIGSRAHTAVANSRALVNTMAFGGTAANLGLAYPNPASGNVIFSDAQAIKDTTVSSSNFIRGFMPGQLCYDVKMLRTAPYIVAPGTILPAGTVAGIPGRVVLYGMGTMSDECAFLLDEDWGDV